MVCCVHSKKETTIREGTLPGCDLSTDIMSLDFIDLGQLAMHMSEFLT